MVEYLKRNRKGFWAGIAGVLALVIAITFIFSYYVPSVVEHKQQEMTATIAADYHADKIYLPGDTPKFRSNAKFKILEIVPHRGMANIGYTIKGEEPVDITKLRNEGKDRDGKDIKGLDWLKEITYVLGEHGVYKMKDGLIVENNSRFVRDTLKYALELSDSEVESYVANESVDVLVVDAEMINKNIKLIQESDFIYIHNNFGAEQSGGDPITYAMKIYQNFSYEAIKGPNPVIYDGYPRFGHAGVADISKDVMCELYKYALINKMPITMDGYITKDEKREKTNYQRLGTAITVAEFCNYSNEYGKKIGYQQIYEVLCENNTDILDSKNGGASTEAFFKYVMSNIGLCSEADAERLKNIFNNDYSKIVDNNFVGDYRTTTICTVAHGGGDQSSISKKVGQMNSNKNIYDDTKHWCKGVQSDTQDVAICINNSLKPSFVVLDVEPDNKFTLTTDIIRSWINNEVQVKILIEQMTMSEFIGINDDLNCSFDAIYFGKNINQMNVKHLYSSGLEANSTKLQNEQGSRVSGARFEFSGNDITDRMAKRVEAFKKAGYPVLYEVDLNKLTPKGEENEATIDENTKMYQFIHRNEEKFYKVKNEALESGKILNTDINNDKPLVYESSTNAKEYTEGIAASMLGGPDGDQLTYKVAQRYGKGKYKAFLYIDSDHNGIFNRWIEKNGKYELDPNYEKPIASADYDCASTAPNNGLLSGKIPPSKRLGVVSWKVELVKLNGEDLTGIRACTTGNTKFNITDKNKIRVLQLSDFSKKSKDAGKAAPNLAAGFTAGETPTAAEQLFKNLATSSVVSDQFTIDVESMDIYDSEFLYLDIAPYDVFVVGFVDQDQKLVDANGLLNKLTIAANKGKGIIFTQDALNYFNNLADSTHWGSDMNSRVRSMLALDRFKVCKNQPIIKPSSSPSPSPSESSGPVAMVPGETEEVSASPLVSEAVSEEPIEPEASASPSPTPEATVTPAPSVVPTAGGAIEAKYMGFTYGLLDMFTDNEYFKINPAKSSTISMNTIFAGDAVDRINSAKIDRYPYVISEICKGFASRSGAYQSDVEENLIKGEDVQKAVGYFCLSNDNPDEEYSVSPKDIRNNYYLWRNDSVFYSGITKDTFQGSGMENELKLFVNTIVSAYGLERSVDISVTNLPDSANFVGGKSYYMYADIDYDKDDFEGTKDIKFTIKTKNLDDCDLTISFYRADSDGNKLTNGTIAQKILTSKTGNTFEMRESEAPDSHKVETKTDYVFKYPLKYMQDSIQYKNLLMEVTTTKNGVGLKDSVLVRVVRRSMFDLD